MLELNKGLLASLKNIYINLSLARSVIVHFKGTLGLSQLEN